MSLQVNRKRLFVKGGGPLQVRQIDPTPSNTFLSLGWIEEEKFAPDYKPVEFEDEMGNQVDYKSSALIVVWHAKLMQAGIDEINFIRNSDGQAFEFYYPLALANGNTQEYLLPVCRIKQSVPLDFKAGTKRVIDLEIHALAPAIALTRTPTDYNTAQYQPYVVIENAVAKGAPSDAATVPQTGL